MIVPIKFREIDSRIPLAFQELDSKLPVNFQHFQQITVLEDVAYYEGEYTVTPRVRPQSVPVAGYRMRKDVQVEAIPYVEISNLQGGKTVNIGGD